MLFPFSFSLNPTSFHLCLLAWVRFPRPSSLVALLPRGPRASLFIDGLKCEKYITLTFVFYLLSYPIIQSFPFNAYFIFLAFPFSIYICSRWVLLFELFPGQGRYGVKKKFMLQFLYQNYENNKSRCKCKFASAFVVAL